MANPVDYEDYTPEVEAHIDAFTDLWPEAAFGPGHIVLADLNVDLRSIDFCLKGLQGGGPLDFGPNWDAEEREATRRFLEELRTWPSLRRLGYAGDDDAG